MSALNDKTIARLVMFGPMGQTKYLYKLLSVLINRMNPNYSGERFKDLIDSFECVIRISTLI